MKRIEDPYANSSLNIQQRQNYARKVWNTRGTTKTSCIFHANNGFSCNTRHFTHCGEGHHIWIDEKKRKLLNRNKVLTKLKLLTQVTRNKSVFEWSCHMSLIWVYHKSHYNSQHSFNNFHFNSILLSNRFIDQIVRICFCIQLKLCCIQPNRMLNVWKRPSATCWFALFKRIGFEFQRNSFVTNWIFHLQKCMFELYGSLDMKYVKRQSCSSLFCFQSKFFLLSFQAMKAHSVSDANRRFYRPTNHMHETIKWQISQFY